MIEAAIWIVWFQIGGVLGLGATEFQAQVVCEAKTRSLALEAHNCTVDVFPLEKETDWADFKNCSGFKMTRVEQKLGAKGFIPNLHCVNKPKGFPYLELK